MQEVARKIVAVTNAIVFRNMIYVVPHELLDVQLMNILYMMHYIYKACHSFLRGVHMG